MLTDIPNTFIQAPMPEINKKVVVKIMGKSVDTSVNMHPDKCQEHVVVCEKGRKVLCAEILQALCRIPEATSVWHTEF